MLDLSSDAGECGLILAQEAGSGTVRWVRDGKAGIELAEPLNLEALAARPKRPSILRR